MGRRRRGAANRTSSSSVERTILEALDCVATPELRDEILIRALQIAGRSTIPTGGAALLEFTSDALRVAVNEQLGTDAADTVRAELEALVEKATQKARSGLRRKTVKRKAQPTPDTLRPSARVILVASFDKNLAGELTKRVGDVARVFGLDDVFALLQAVESHATSNPILIVDCLSTSLRPATIASLARVLQAGSRVLLWGAEPELEQRLVAEGPTITWVPVAKEATVEELAWLCALPLPPAEETERQGLILLVDDDHPYIDAIARLLRASRYEVVCAYGGQEAMEVCSERKPALILTDLNMPGMNGLQFSSAIRLMYGEASPPIALITAADVGTADLTAVNRALRKPVAPDDLLTLVSDLLPRADSSDCDG